MDGKHAGARGHARCIQTYTHVHVCVHMRSHAGTENVVLDIKAYMNETLIPNLGSVKVRPFLARLEALSMRTCHHGLLFPLLISCL